MTYIFDARVFGYIIRNGVQVLLTTESCKDPDDSTSYIMYGFDIQIFGESIHHIRTRYSRARHFHGVLEEAKLLQHFKPSLNFPARCEVALCWHAQSIKTNHA